MSKPTVCPGCLSTQSTKYTRGWAWLMFLVGAFMVPVFGVGLLFIGVAAFCGTARRCRQCKGEALIPQSTPRGQQLLDQSAALTAQAADVASR